MANHIEIVYGHLPKNLSDSRRIFLEYIAYMREYGFSFPGAESEIEGLPGPFAPEHRGAIFLGRENGTLAGCVAIKQWNDKVAELNRFYSRRQNPVKGMGTALAVAALWWAHSRGYREVRLETHQSLKAAKKVYGDLDFEGISSYRGDSDATTNLEGVIYYRTDLNNKFPKGLPFPNPPFEIVILNKDENREK